MNISQHVSTLCHRQEKKILWKKFFGSFSANFQKSYYNIRAAMKNKLILFFEWTLFSANNYFLPSIISI